MINKSDLSDVKPFTGLSPEVVLDAAASVGLDVDGRLFALNSYEKPGVSTGQYGWQPRAEILSSGALDG